MAASVLYDEHPSMARSNPLIFLLALLLVPVGIGIVILLVWWVKSRTVRLRVTEEEVEYEAGLFSKERREMKRTSIRSVTVDQTLLDRLFRVGTVAIYSSGDSPEIVVRGLPDPERLRALL
ncbi:PH domain-containing protein [Propylenella binzhouense]|uniref:PH domain-containing protein n=1 Tax=Propylenella binzhouense TaxID=2555902 RepID=A0A964T5Z5_9HYPH|nr:PH domain-containing protein [Propylenella binzhouense]MYZ48434.1 PH domain-containing protein [Propylenella binzhouense]